jgi:hypothetical protein
MFFWNSLHQVCSSGIAFIRRTYLMKAIPEEHLMKAIPEEHT